MFFKDVFQDMLILKEILGINFFTILLKNMQCILIMLLILLIFLPDPPNLNIQLYVFSFFFGKRK